MNLTGIYRQLSDDEINTIIAASLLLQDKHLDVALIPFVNIVDAIGNIHEMVNIYTKRYNELVHGDAVEVNPGTIQSFHTRQRLLTLLGKLMRHWGARRCLNKRGDTVWRKGNAQLGSIDEYTIMRAYGEPIRNIPQVHRRRNRAAGHSA